jgi:hypothetical protein
VSDKDWILDNSEALYPLERVIDSDDQSWGMSPAFKGLRCPVCGSSYQRTGEPEFIPGSDAYRAGWGGRGGLLIIPVRGECGHGWEMCFGFHKGETATFVRIFDAGESAGQGGVS